MQREHIEDMEVGDFIQLPQQEWHLNHEAKAIFAAAQERMRKWPDPATRPQYQVENEPEFKSRLERIR